MKTQLSPHTAQPKTIIGNGKSGSKVTAETKPAATWAGRWSELPADHLKRWEKRLYTPKSGGLSLRKLAVRIQHLGRREEFRFDTTNHAAAAAQALERFRFLNANGWDATLAKFKPGSTIAPKLNVTVGDYVAAARDLRKLRERTLNNYANCLRTITAEILGIRPDRGTSKFDYRSPANGHAAWLAKIDATRLEEITSDRLNTWKRDRIAAAGSSSAAVASARRTINSYLRCARSLFGRKIVRELKELGHLTLPDPLPFAGIDLEEAGSMKYKSRIDAAALIAAAREELKPAHPEAYKAFVLGLFAGMRKAEIDLLEWRMIDFPQNLIRVEETEWLHLKTADSAADITVDPEVIRELRDLMPPPTARPAPWSQFVLASLRPPRPESPRPYYRCQSAFAELSRWLKSKGVRANKPLHELRKEIGALIATRHGIYAASRFLRHSDIGVTARFYADQKQRISVGLGQLLTTTPAIVATPAAAIAQSA
ncbi:hypothetical protein LBMAG56_43210 [Verrucomicrobiota bacterium]|nr:hypothetical protein LBMAG56_43210 [Verrucomicrobiota bacterium]